MSTHYHLNVEKGSVKINIHREPWEKIQSNEAERDNSSVQTQPSSQKSLEGPVSDL